MSTPLTVPSGDLGHGPLVIAVTWVFMAMAIMAVSLCVYARRCKGVALNWDVWLMIVALICRFVFQIRTTYSLKYGLGKHDKDLTPDNIIHILQYNWIAQPSSIVVSSLARISITILLIRIFGAVHKKFKWFLIIITTTLCIGGILVIPLIFCQVTPVEGLWNIYIVPERRIDARAWIYTAYFVTSLWAFTDLTYVLFPVIFIWKLQMPMRRKIGLMLLMCASLFTMTMSILKAISIASAARATHLSVDVQYRASLAILYDILEQDTVITMGCIPSLRTVFDGKALRLSYVRNSISVLVRKSGSRQSSASSRSSVDKIRGDKAMNEKLGAASTNGEPHGVTITACPQGDSQETLDSGSGQIKRTDQWNVAYFTEVDGMTEVV